MKTNITGSAAPLRVPPIGEVDHGGAWITLGGRQYKVPPLNFRALRELKSDIESLQAPQVGGGLPSQERIGAICRVVYAAISRNYPRRAWWRRLVDPALGDEISERFIAETIDLGNATEVILATMDVSSFKRAPEDPPPGETLAR